jgi:23S rRNA (uracil-5-)-methyltransferase RumA
VANFQRHRHAAGRERPEKFMQARDEDRAPYEPPCPHFPHCVGCPWIDVPYPQQLKRKHALVREALADYPSLAGIDPTAVAPARQRLGYRGRIKLVVRQKRDQVAIGLYVPQTHRVIDISSCPVHPRPVNQVVHYLKKKIVELGIAPYDERDDSGDLRYLDFRFSAARQELSITLITRRPVFPRGAELARALLRRFSFVTGVIQNINEQRGNVIWGGSFRVLGGRDTIMERIGDLKLVFPPGAFSQANPFTARQIYETVLQAAALTGVETVLDLYCGVGPISLYLSSAARQIWAVDDNEGSINTAKQNARRNGRGNCRFIAGDVAATVTQLKQQLPRIDLAVLNPPRKGVQPAALQAIVDLQLPRLIYVSCEPKTLARDLARLADAGYRAAQVRLFDMFPQTDQVESVAVLNQASQDDR